MINQDSPYSLQILSLLMQGGLLGAAVTLLTLVSTASARRKDRELELRSTRQAAQEERADQARERRYEDQRDALLAFQVEVVSLQIQADNFRYDNLYEGSTEDVIQWNLRLEPLTIAYYRALAFSDKSTAEAATALYRAIHTRIKDWEADETIETALREWSRAVHKVLLLQPSTDLAAQKKA